MTKTNYVKTRGKTTKNGMSKMSIKKKTTTVKKPNTTKATQSHKTSKSAKISKERSQRAKKMNRNPDGTFAKTKKPSRASSPKKTGKPVKKNQSHSRQNRHSITYSTKGFTPKMTAADKSIDTSDCSSATRKKVLSAVAENFTKEELTTIAESTELKVTDKSEKQSRNKAGSYDRPTVENPKAKITLKSDSGVSTITHEFVHHLRTVDRSRKKYAKTAYPVDSKGNDKSQLKHGISYKGMTYEQVNCAEESATTAETEIRLKHKSIYLSSYWGRDKLPSEREKIRDEDRKTLREDRNGNSLKDGKNITGKRAVEYLNRNYPRTTISQNRPNGSSKTALNIFREIINKRAKRRW